MMFTALSYRSQKLVYFHPNNGIGNPLENKLHRALKINQSPRAHKKFTHFCSVQFVLVSKCSEAKSHKFRSEILTMSKLLHSCNDINFIVYLRDLFLVKPSLGFKYFTNYFCITSPMKATNTSSPENEIILKVFKIPPSFQFETYFSHSSNHNLAENFIMRLHSYTQDTGYHCHCLFQFSKPQPITQYIFFWFFFLNTEYLYLNLVLKLHVLSLIEIFR